MPTVARDGMWAYREILVSPLPSSALAFVSTLHVALALLRKERRGSGTILAASLSFAAAPWLLPSAAGVVLGLALHLAWFAACEKLAGRPPAPSRLPPTARPPAGFLPVPVLAVFDETPEIRTFRFARPSGFVFEAGQFLSVRVRVAGKPLVRCYTISSAPGATDHLEITVKRQGAVSTALHATLRPGVPIEIRGPGGHFRYPAGDPRPMLMIGGGVGATPLMSMLRHAAAADRGRAVTLLLSVRTEADIPFRAELEAIERRHPTARVVFAVTRGRADPSRFPGRIDADLLRSVAPAAADSLCYVCGPLPMIAAMKTLLAGLGVPAGRIHAEAFEAAVAWASPELARAARPGGGGREASRAPHEIAFVRSGTTVPASATATLLETAEAAGIPIEFSCRSGICGTCRTRLVDGEVDGDPGALDEAERREGWILPCVSFARGKCAIDA